MDVAVKLLVNKYYHSVVALRRYFHMYPEVSGCEYRTQQKIISELQAIGLQPRRVAGTGVIADIVSTTPGKTLALRADIDALKLVDECAQSYQSIHHGICHACGHDGHIAILLGVAKMLVEMKDKFSGRVRLLFEPSEEAFPGGASALITEGVLEEVDAIIGLHVWQPLEVGTMGIAYGAMMASPDEFTITVKGGGGHAGMPQHTQDALLIGSQIVQGLNTIVSRNVDPLEPAVVSVGVFHSGEMPNIIADTAVMKGTVRSFRLETRRNIFHRIEQVVRGICSAGGATYEIKTIWGFPPVTNDRNIALLVADAAQQSLGEENVVEISPVMVGEDFSLYQQQVPGAFFFVGAGNKEKGICYPQHHPKYDIDEQALAHGMEIMLRAVLNFGGMG